MRKRSAAIAASLFLALALAPAASAADPTMPLSDVRSGMKCTSLSVVRGTTISSFDVEVLDVVASDSNAGGPRILVRVSGPAVEPGGIGAGFSGSPVYCPDAAGVSRNAGAISEGVGDYGNQLALVTPIESILGETPAPPATARRDPALIRSARPLATPLTETGLTTRARALLVRAGRRAGIPVLSVPPGPAGGYPVQTLRPGAAVTTAFATGDIALGAVGTATYRDGANVWAFGHPLDDAGPRSLFLQDAYVYGVIPNPISVDDLGLGTYKFAAAGGHTVGTLTNDADSAVVGKVGAAPPTISLQASARERGTPNAAAVSAQLADERQLGLGAGAATAAPIALSVAVDKLIHSLAPVTMSMCVRFRVAERRNAMGFCNNYFAPEDASLDFADAADLVESYDFGPLRLQAISARARLTRGVREDVLLRGRAPRSVRPGQRIRMRLTVHRKRRGTNRTLSFLMRVPRSLRPGRRTVVLRGTGLGGSAELESELETSLLDLVGESAPDNESRRPHSIGELAARVQAFRRGTGIVARFTPPGPRTLVYRSGSVAFTGTLRVPLRVGRR